MQKKKKIGKLFWMITALGLLLGFLSVGIFTGISVSDGVLNQTQREKTVENESKYLSSIGVTRQQIEEDLGGAELLSIPSTYGNHHIPASYFKTDEPARRGVAILVHGLGGTRTANYPVAQMFLNLGYDVLTYDQRNSGENTAPYNTFGFMESYDLLDCVNYVNQDLPQQQKLAVWGCSFGGATVGIALGREKQGLIDYAVLDCPISDGEFLVGEAMKEISQEIGLPKDFLMFTGNLALRAKVGFGFQDLRVTDWIAETSVPVLVFHTEIDRVTPAFMGRDLYNAVPHDNKKIVTVQDSGHAKIFEDYPELYQAELAAFLGED